MQISLVKQMRRIRLVRLFHTLIAGSGDPAYRDWPGGIAGRVPSRGGVAPVQSVCEISGLGACSKTLQFVGAEVTRLNFPWGSKEKPEPPTPKMARERRHPCRPPRAFHPLWRTKFMGTYVGCYSFKRLLAFVCCAFALFPLPVQAENNPTLVQTQAAPGSELFTNDS